jgi:alpha/beta superfamily hydrolase
MHNAIIVAMVNALACASSHVGSLRFNFRSVEGAKGRHFCRNAGPVADAHEEQLDVIGAIDGLLNAFSGIAVSIVGYSFGSMVGLRAAWAHPEVDRIALIAPAVRIFSYAEGHACRRPLPTDILVGDRDRFAPVAEVRSLAKCLGARLHTISGADHFFEGHQQDVAQMLLPCVAPETCTAERFLR